MNVSKVFMNEIIRSPLLLLVRLTSLGRLFLLAMIHLCCLHLPSRCSHQVLYLTVTLSVSILGLLLLQWSLIRLLSRMALGWTHTFVLYLYLHVLKSLARLAYRQNVSRFVNVLQKWSQLDKFPVFLTAQKLLNLIKVLRLQYSCHLIILALRNILHQPK